MRTVWLPGLLFVSLSLAQVPDSMLPAHNPAAAIVRHHAYTLEYAEPFEQAGWVIYHLTKEHLEGTLAERGNNFRADPDVPTGSASPADYTRSGYDRGHLSPAADNAWSQETMSESFFMSNMSPQEPGFNRGIWKRLEDQVRSWGREYGSLWIVVGPVLKDSLSTIGANHVAVPGAYFKVVADLDKCEEKMIAFLMPNQPSKEPLAHFAVSVDSVENLTGIDFFSELPDSLENALESTVNANGWDFTNFPASHHHVSKTHTQE